jgi:F0F1-type ATP synthase membrane subunit b/b'
VKLNLKEKIEFLREEIKIYVDTSIREKKEAEEKLSLINKKIEHLPEQIKDIELSTINSVKSIGEKIKADIEEQKQDMANSAERIFNLEMKKFKQKIRVNF